MWETREFEELLGLLRRVAYCCVAAVVLGIVFLSTPSDNSIAQRAFFAMSERFVPQGVELVAIRPLDAFNAEIGIACMLGGAVMMPILLLVVIRYMFVALHNREQHLAIATIVSFAFLFSCGVLFAYYLLIPITFNILYSLATPMGVKPLFSVGSLVSSVLGLSVGSGVLFLLPIVMVFVSQLGIVESNTWGQYVRYALFVTLVVTAIITPDGSGLTMIILSVPVMLLYCMGWGVSVALARYQK